MSWSEQSRYILLVENEIEVRSVVLFSHYSNDKIAYCWGVLGIVFALEGMRDHFFGIWIFYTKIRIYGISFKIAFCQRRALFQVQIGISSLNIHFYKEFNLLRREHFELIQIIVHLISSHKSTLNDSIMQFSSNSLLMRINFNEKLFCL